AADDTRRPIYGNRYCAEKPGLHIIHRWRRPIPARFSALEEAGGLSVRVLGAPVRSVGIHVHLFGAVGQRLVALARAAPHDLCPGAGIRELPVSADDRGIPARGGSASALLYRFR